MMLLVTGCVCVCVCVHVHTHTGVYKYIPSERKTSLLLFEELHVLPLRDPLFYLLDVCGIYKGRADCRQPGGDFQNILPCASWVE